MFERSYNTNLENCKKLVFQNYQTPITYGNDTFYLTFDIDKAKSFAQSGKLTKHQFEVTELINRLSNFQPLTVGKRSIAEPLIVAPFPLAEGRLLLIDGNHRLSVALKYNVKHIEFLFFDDFSMARELIPSRFELAYYTYTFDMLHVLQMIEHGVFALKDTLLYEFYSEEF